MASGPTTWSAPSSTKFRSKAAVASPKVGAKVAAGRFDESFLRKLEALTVVAKRARGGGPGPERRSRRVGAGIEFADHRDYAPGDDVRALDWNLFARLDRPFVRLREENEDLTLTLIVDGSGSMALGTPPKLELAVRIAAALAYIGLSSLDRVRLCLVGPGVREALPAMRGQGSTARVLDLLERANAVGRTDLGMAVREVLAAASATRRGFTVLVSDLFDPAGSVRALDRLRVARHEVVVVQITAADDAAVPLDGDVVLEDAETGELREVTITPATRKAHAERYASLLRGIAGACRERGVACFQIASTVPFEDAGLRILRVGRVVA
jgi:uncharacterized protein (DUF58 family)